MGIPVGECEVYIIDTYNCKYHNAVMIEMPEELSVEVSNIADIACEGNTTGLISLNTSGGTLPYSYAMNNTTIILSNNSISNLATGNYIIQVKDKNNCTAETKAYIGTVNYKPRAQFNIDYQAGQVVRLENLSVFAESYEWTFGDVKSALKNPIHIYETDGVYDIILKATNECGSNSTTQSVNVINTSIATESGIFTTKVYPNPSNGKFVLNIENAEIQGDITIRIFDVTSKLVITDKFEIQKSIQRPYDLSSFGSGIYFIEIQSGTTTQNLKVVITK